MIIGEVIGWVGIGFGFLVAPPQLIKMIKTGGTKDVSLLTYVALVLALTCYLLHAIYIGSAVFIVAQSLNLTTNGAILIYMLRKR